MTKSELIQRIEAHIPQSMLREYRKTKRFFIWEIQQRAYIKAINFIRKKKDALNVIFIIANSAEWKYDSIYQLMQKESSFNPIIFVCPLVGHYTDSQAKRIFQHTFEIFKGRGYNVLKACENIYDQSIDIKELKPDIIFYSSLWTGYIHPKYNEKSLHAYLKCYVNYGFSNTAGEWGYASSFHGLMWKYFAECEDIRTIAVEAQPREMQNIVVTGYPIYDEYQAAQSDTSIWKDLSPKYKRIIWAPHHSIEGHNGLLKLSTFLEIAEEMLELAETYQDKCQFAFKPHPLLLQALYDHPKWGKEQADAYYQQWADGKNTTIVNGSYMELFKSSDAMMHDCGSFIVEYLYTQKPVMYLGGNRDSQSNIVGKKAYQCHYHGKTIDDIKRFLDEVVLSSKDEMKPIREQFYNEVLLPPNGCSVAENIINEIKKELFR